MSVVASFKTICIPWIVLSQSPSFHGSTFFYPPKNLLAPACDLLGRSLHRLKGLLCHVGALNGESPPKHEAFLWKFMGNSLKMVNMLWDIYKILFKNAVSLHLVNLKAMTIYKQEHQLDICNSWDELTMKHGEAAGLNHQTIVIYPEAINEECIWVCLKRGNTHKWPL